MEQEKVRRGVEDYFRALSKRDVDAWVSTFTPDGETHEPVGSAGHQGHAQLSIFASNLFQRFELVKFVIDHLYVVGLQAAAKWTGTGVTRGGNAFLIEGIDIFAMNSDGKIQRVDAYWHPSLPA